MVNKKNSFIALLGSDETPQSEKLMAVSSFKRFKRWLNLNLFVGYRKLDSLPRNNSIVAVLRC